MTTRFMLDTNVVSAFMHSRNSLLDRRIANHANRDLCMSAISHGETLYGLARRPDAIHLAAAAAQLLEVVNVLPWTAETATRYGDLRAQMRRSGRALQPLDMLIAAHALEAGATLVTSDGAFQYVPGLAVEDWTAP
jgi:tRNA(fMet)-specific endonuclease VapC